MCCVNIKILPASGNENFPVWTQPSVICYNQPKVEDNIPAGCTWYYFLPNRLFAHILRISSSSIMITYICFKSTLYQFQLTTDSALKNSLILYYRLDFSDTFAYTVTGINLSKGRCTDDLQCLSLHLVILYCLLYDEFLILPPFGWVYSNTLLNHMLNHDATNDRMDISIWIF